METAKVQDVPKHRRGVEIELLDGNMYHLPLLGFDDGLDLMNLVSSDKPMREKMLEAKGFFIKALSVEYGEEGAKQIVDTLLPADFNERGVIMRGLLGMINMPIPEEVQGD
jgi:hypothetical protein